MNNYSYLRSEMRIIVLLFICFSCQSVKSKSLNITLDPLHGIDNNSLNNCYLRSDPTTVSGTVQEVFIGIHVLDIDQINEGQMDFRLHCYFQASWNNPRLNLTILNHYGYNYKVVMLPHQLTNCMWKPDIYFPNTVEIKTFRDMVPNHSFKYFTDGKILREERFIFRIACPMKFEMFPFDSQHCTFKISLMGNTDDKVTLRWDTKLGAGGIAFHEQMHPLQFYISHPTLGSHIDDFGNGVKYAELRASILFHRRLTGSFLNFYIPSTLVVVLSWISFYIDVDAAPARVTLSVTALLTISTQMIQARDSLPPVQYITCMDVWLFFCMSLVFASFIEYSIAYSNRKQSRQTPKQSHNPRRDTLKGTGNNQTEAWPIEKQNSKILTSNTTVKLDKVSRWIFPLTMIIFCVVYWSFIFCNTEIKFTYD